MDKEYSLEEIRQYIFPDLNLLQDDKAKQIVFDQYKMLLENSQKLGERVEASNNLFIGSNTFIFTAINFFIRDLSFKGNEESVIVGSLICIGLVASFSWQRVVSSYKKTSALNYLLVRVIEQTLPCRVFSFKFKAESEKEKSAESTKHANIIVYLQSIMPKLFLFGYTACTVIALLIHFKLLNF